MSKLYDIIYADPPWDYGGQTQHSGTKNSNSGSAIKHYPTMTVDKMLEQITVPAADNSLLFMWTSSPHLNQAIHLGEGWNFRYSTVAFVWNKCALNPSFYTMSETELCLVFKRGKIPTPRGSRNERQLVSERRRQHSRKPDQVRERIERMFPTQSRLEMFARTRTPNWDCIGNQTNLFEHAV